MRDFFEEIFSSIRKNKLRTFLTGFSIAWGIFMLIILLGSGNGLKNGMLENFRFMSTNSLTIFPGRTNVAYKGMAKSRRIILKEDDAEVLRGSLQANASKVIPMIRTGNKNIANKSEFTNNNIGGVTPDYLGFINSFIIASKGRNINETDLQEERKVIVIHEKTAKILFRDNDNPVGEYVNLDNIPFKIAGIYSEFSGGEQNPRAFIPITTARSIFQPSGEINDISMELVGLDTKEQNELFEEQIRNRLAQKHQFDPSDKNALWIWNRLSDYMQMQGIFNGISFFVWIIGIGTLIAGIVGISNIMLITVKERTHEFGVRKALGATPLSILSLVLTESVIITAIFGYVGMIAGVGLTELINFIMTQSMDNSGSEDSVSIFKNPTVELSVIFMATAILIIAGLIAGYVPAKRAVSIKPIDALRGE